MKHGCKHIAAIFLFIIVCSSSRAQVKVRATVDRDNILIGEPIALTIEVYLPLGTKMNWPVADTIPHFEITTRSAPDTVDNIDGKKITQTLTITSFDSGRWQIPPFELLVEDTPFYTDSLPINVSFTPFDPAEDYRDIKDIIEVTNPNVQYIPWALAGLAIVSLAALVVLFRKRNLVPVKADKKTTPDISAYDEAMQSLRKLKGRLPVNGAVKDYYSELNDILRKYVGRRFNVPTFERTNEELIMQLGKLNISRDPLISLAQSLRMSDFVKFAKYVPSDSDNENNLQVVKDSIDTLDKNYLSAV